jgi:GNAT superfamily N-acetyltransferase
MITDRAAPGDVERIMAVACVKPWKGRVVVDSTLERSEREQLGPRDWEVALCAADSEPRYRRKGLVSKCVTALVQHLQARTSGVPVVLWVSALVNVGSVEYWERRGFIQQGEPDLAAIGTWGSVAPFRIATLKRVHK